MERGHLNCSRSVRPRKRQKLSRKTSCGTKKESCACPKPRFHHSSNKVSCAKCTPNSTSAALLPKGGRWPTPLARPPGATALRWRLDTTVQPDEFRPQPFRNTYAHIPAGGLRITSWNTRGLLGFSSLDPDCKGPEVQVPSPTARSARETECFTAQSTVLTQCLMTSTFADGNLSAGGSAVLSSKTRSHPTA